MNQWCQTMRNDLYHIERSSMTTLQSQIRETLVSAVLSGQLAQGDPIPSTRAMAGRLKVSRNTVMLAYQSLAADGFLESRERSGFYVTEAATNSAASYAVDSLVPASNRSQMDWNALFHSHPAKQLNLTKPTNWHDYPYPFVYGQSDPSLFPIAEWRECSRQALGRQWLEDWTADHFGADDPMLVEQIRKRILPRRGIQADPDNILITMGAQNALYLLAHLLISSKTKVAIEDPGYPDMRNIMSLNTDHVFPVDLDESGIMVNNQLAEADLVYVTPSHQFPTNRTMPIERRKELLDWANDNDRLIIEDDYEFETNYLGGPCPSLKSLDVSGRVLYVGSLSKSLVPGLRMGFMVAPRRVITEARALRRLMLRHPPGNNQRVVSLFLALGHYDTLVSRLHRHYAERWKVMSTALEKHLPGWSQSSSFGGTSFWLTGPADLDSNWLARLALEDGIVIETGAVCHHPDRRVNNTFRLGFSSIPLDRIEAGIERLAAVIKRMNIQLGQRKPLVR
jgi:GntR family transcriptional regulator/MocR family aminotransferase